MDSTRFYRAASVPSFQGLLPIRNLLPKLKPQPNLRFHFHPLQPQNSAPKLKTKSKKRSSLRKIQGPKHTGFCMYISDYASSMDFTLLRLHQIHAVLALGSDCPPLASPMVKGGYKVLTQVDENPSDFLICFDQAMDFIVNFLKTGNILVYCRNCRSRSSAIAIGYLIVRHGLDFNEAFKEVSKAVGSCALSPYHIQQLHRICKRKSLGGYSRFGLINQI